jgi:predicted enzyme related to lactoylglutathione lyase
VNLSIVTLYVQDMDRARQFYTQVVGIPEFEPFSSPMFVTLRPAVGSMLALQHVSTVPADQLKPAGGVELNFEVEHVDQVFAEWQAAGVKMISSPQDKPFGRVFTAQDPDGNLLSVYRLAAR